jgi:hypothetical protein
VPYIPDERRIQIGSGDSFDTAGELNYLLTMAVLEYLGDSPNYERFNAAIGALESCKQEVYRRLIAPYEDRKIKENGDVFE